MNTILIYGFSIITLVSGLFVVIERNPVHAVFFLIVAFCNAAGLLFCIGAEFLAFLFLVVYVGAIAVLFLFVVMMLNVKVEQKKAPYIPFIFILGLIVLGELYLLSPSLLTASISAPIASYFGNSLQELNYYTDWYDTLNSFTNLEGLGLFLYTDGIIYFLLAGIILLVSMIGAISLTLYRRAGVKRQHVTEQVFKDYSSLIKLRSIESR